jgi:hypothetical protein
MGVRGSGHVRVQTGQRTPSIIGAIILLRIGPVGGHQASFLALVKDSWRSHHCQCRNKKRQRPSKRVTHQDHENRALQHNQNALLCRRQKRESRGKWECWTARDQQIHKTIATQIDQPGTGLAEHDTESASPLLSSCTLLCARILCT